MHAETLVLCTSCFGVLYMYIYIYILWSQVETKPALDDLNRIAELEEDRAVRRHSQRPVTSVLRRH